MIGSRIRVLLVDDDEEDYLITTGVIEEIPGPGYDVTWRDSYDAALETLATGQFDILVFDYRLGRETGIDLLKEVKARNYAAPVILLTGQQDAAVDDEAVRLGAADYLIKGKITADTFERSVRHALRHNETLSQLHESNAFLQSILDALSSEVAILDAQGIILAVNRAWQSSFDADHEDSVGLNFLTWRLDVPEEEKAVAEKLVDGVRQVTHGERDSFVIECPLTSSGRSRWVIARVSSFASAAKLFVVVAYEDITERKMAEMQLELNRARLEELSTRDELTSLYNRRYFNTVFSQEIARSERQACEFSLLMLDVDRFKSVNDTHGHQAGDDALRHVAQVCKAVCRSSDCLARFGGEEMVFILPDTNLDGALMFAERVRAAIERAPAPVTSDSGQRLQLNISASLGVSVFPGDGKSPEELISVADKGLYTAKSTGRNRVCYAAA